MTSYVSVDGDPEGVKRNANLLASAGKDATGPVHAALQKVQSHEAAKPWGNDKAGQEFHKNYVQAGDDGTPANAAVQKGAAGMGPALQTLGENVVKVINAYEKVDGHGAGDIKKVQL